MSQEQQRLEEALGWLVELREASGGDPQHQRWRAWLAADPRNHQAWQRVEALQQRLSGPQGRLLLSAWRGSPAQGSRRAFVGKLCLLLAGGGALAYSGQRLAWPELSADYRTRTGEQRQVTLANRGDLLLNTGTALDLRMLGDSARITLLHGEFLLDSVGPSQVDGAGARLHAAGPARFAMRSLARGECRICVYRGQVAVSLAGRGDYVVAAERQLQVSPTAIEQHPLPYASDAWSRGLLISDGMPLGQFLAELDRYRAGILRCHPQVAGLRISGTFDLRQPEQVLATLPQVLPVRLQYRSRYWASVVPVA